MITQKVKLYLQGTSIASFFFFISERSKSDATSMLEALACMKHCVRWHFFTTRCLPDLIIHNLCVISLQ